MYSAYLREATSALFRPNSTRLSRGGHAVLATAIANKPQLVTIEANGDTLGRARAYPSTRVTSRVQVYLAGFAAEHILTKRRSPQLAREIRFALVARTEPGLREAFTGFETRDGDRAVEEVHRTVVGASDDEIEREVERYYEAARQSLSAVWRYVDSVATALLSKTALDRDALDEALGDGDIYAPVFAVQRKHALMSPLEVGVHSRCAASLRVRRSTDDA